MRKVLGVVAVLVLAAAVLHAGGPPREGGEGRQGGRRRGGFMGRGDMRARFGGMFGRREQQLDVFDTAQRYFELTEEQQAALGKLGDQYAAEEHLARLEAKKRLDAKFIKLVVEILAGEDKDKYEQVTAAMAAHDEAVEAATQALLDVLTKVREAQGVERQGPPRQVPSGKTDIVRRYLKLSDEQREQIDELRRDGFRGMRDRMGEVPRPEDWRDAEARRRFFEGLRGVAQKIDEETAQAVVPLLTDEQRPAYDTAAKALDEYNAKVKEADETLEKKLIEILGEEKVRAARQRVPFGRFGPPRPGEGPPPPGEGPPRGGPPQPQRGEDF